MIHRKLGMCAALFFGLTLAASAGAADMTTSSAVASKVAQQTPNATEASKMLAPERVFAQLSKQPSSAFVALENDCEHVTHTNFCACYPDACHN